MTSAVILVHSVNQKNNHRSDPLRPDCDFQGSDKYSPLWPFSKTAKYNKIDSSKIVRDSKFKVNKSERTHSHLVHHPSTGVLPSFQGSNAAIFLPPAGRYMLAHG